MLMCLVYPGIAQIVERAAWDREAAGAGPATRTIRRFQQKIFWVKMCYKFESCYLRLANMAQR